MSLKITAIDLQNFQSHKRTRIPVGDFTVLMGLSSTGKTTVLRALQFLFYGEWDATYPNDDKIATAVAVEFENGTRVIRMRKGAVNSAAVATNTSDGPIVTKYKSFGAIIPGMFNILNVRPIDIGSKEVNLNFSMQDDPLFMVSESRPVKAQWLGRLYGAHVINDMLKLMAKDKTRADGKRKDSEERLKKYDVELEQYKNIEEHAAAVADCQKMLKDLQGIKKLVDVREMLNADKKNIEASAWVMGLRLTDVRDDLRLLADMKALVEKKNGIVEDRAFIENYSMLLKTDLSKMKKGIQVMADLNKIVARLETIRQSRTELWMRLSELGMELESKKDDLDEVLVDGKCPACGHDVGPEAVKGIAENIKRLL